MQFVNLKLHFYSIILRIYALYANITPVYAKRIFIVHTVSARLPPFANQNPQSAVLRGQKAVRLLPQAKEFYRE